MVPTRDCLPLPDIRSGAGKEVNGRGARPPNPCGAGNRNGKGTQAGEKAPEAAGIGRLLVVPRGAEVEVNVAAQEHRRGGRCSHPGENLQHSGAVARGEVEGPDGKGGRALAIRRDYSVTHDDLQPAPLSKHAVAEELKARRDKDGDPP